MAEQGSIKDRLYAFLKDCETGVRADVLASDVMGLRGARGGIAEKIVGAAIEGDARFVRLADGAFTLKTTTQASLLQQTVFVCIGVVEGDGQIELAARRVRVQGVEGLFPQTVIGGQGDNSEGLRAFASFAEGAIPVAFRLPRHRRIVNGLGRYFLGRLLLKEGICLHRLGRRVFPDQALPDLETLAKTMSLVFVADRGAEGEASLQTEVLLGLLTQCERIGLSTVEAVMADLYPDPTPVRFEAYAFDETYVRELPEAPGVYVMRDQQGQVIYVGKAVNLRQRVGSYFAKRAERPEKTKRILERIWSMEVETVGSELEALILESRLIALCQPMFNTQVVVHDRDVDLGALKNWMLILPSAENDCVELFCMVQGGALMQVRARQDLRDWDMVVDLLKARYFQNAVHEKTLSVPEKAELSIVSGWVALNKETLNVLDMDALGSPENALRIVSEYVQHCERENWEKVVWRV